MRRSGYSGRYKTSKTAAATFRDLMPPNVTNRFTVLAHMAKRNSPNVPLTFELSSREVVSKEDERGWTILRRDGTKYYRKRDPKTDPAYLEDTWKRTLSLKGVHPTVYEHDEINDYVVSRARRLADPEKRLLILDSVEMSSSKAAIAAGFSARSIVVPNPVEDLSSEASKLGVEYRRMTVEQYVRDHPNEVFSVVMLDFTGTIGGDQSKGTHPLGALSLMVCNGMLADRAVVWVTFSLRLYSHEDTKTYLKEAVRQINQQSKYKLKWNRREVYRGAGGSQMYRAVFDVESKDVPVSHASLDAILGAVPEPAATPPEPAGSLDAILGAVPESSKDYATKPNKIQTSRKRPRSEVDAWTKNKVNTHLKILYALLQVFTCEMSDEKRARFDVKLPDDFYD